jgi:hypothetical protein
MTKWMHFSIATQAVKGTRDSSMVTTGLLKVIEAGDVPGPKSG